MKTVQEQCQMISDIALAIGAGKEIQEYFFGTSRTSGWGDTSKTIEEIAYQIRTRDSDFRVKPEPKTEKRKAYWSVDCCGNPSLWFCPEDRFARVEKAREFISWAKPTIEPDGFTISFEVPTE